MATLLRKPRASPVLRHPLIGGAEERREALRGLLRYGLRLTVCPPSYAQGLGLDLSKATLNPGIRFNPGLTQVWTQD